MNTLASALLAESAGLLSDTVVAAFAILGGAAGFVSLIITLVHRRQSQSGPAAVTPIATAPATPATAPAALSVAVAKPAVVAPAPTVDDSIPADVMALISAAVAMTLGRHARIAAVVPVNGPPVELLQQWSIEGRRQIYSSHQIR